ncbi:TetR/AcrR family transcriptional regulator [Microbispora bryophytorum]|uniref:TetR family transcriptional regulator n=1 Tax=Microbispora bryophytorum TaxID=1460882 RepID=A0A8H9HA79_9ACTN|nr:TetR/AcrR family transcriptional regulator [Microbispora bryophytorum]MBD3141062.1 helix-turn-helix transcriptional regulator [Microbispora bryophytorum]TQS02167.1 helix-turn-helix transcriptional regulator [Microbispora bryophytorum]GGO29632.1 TetR family transcriptional regulator [Microbispora bryophytorum]
MARTKEFDPDVVLERALDLFWRRGYEATSMADLVEHLGIGRASLYATFGGKHDLYVKALERYAQTRDPNLVELLSQPGPALPAVRTLVERYTEESIRDRDRRGCMIVNAATELLPDDEPVARLVEASWTGLETALTSALIRARAQGEISAESDPRVLARFVLVFLQGVRVMGKGHGDAARLRDAAAQALAMLR